MAPLPVPMSSIFLNPGCFFHDPVHQFFRFRSWYQDPVIDRKRKPGLPQHILQGFTRHHFFLGRIPAFFFPVNSGRAKAAFPSLSSSQMRTMKQLLCLIEPVSCCTACCRYARRDINKEAVCAGLWVTGWDSNHDPRTTI